MPSPKSRESESGPPIIDPGGNGESLDGWGGPGGGPPMGPIGCIGPDSMLGGCPPMKPSGGPGKKPSPGGGGPKFGGYPKSWNGLSWGKYPKSSPIMGNPRRPPLPGGKNPRPAIMPLVICFIRRSLLRLFWNQT